MAERSTLNDCWYHFMRWMCQMTGVLCCQVRHTGRQNIPRKGGVLVVANHQSHFDPPLVGMPGPRRMNYLARDTLFSFKPFGWLIGSIGSIPIDPSGRAIGGIKTALRCLKRGEIVVMFPEGSRSPDGKIQAFRPGFTTLAVRSKAAILPVGIEGAYDGWPRDRKLPRLCNAHVHYGTPILPDEVAAYEERELIAEVERRIHECCDIVRQHPLFAGRPKKNGDR
jgi:1-acyl-sn-glycerol-3-phosphate acyltransferase